MYSDRTDAGQLYAIPPIRDTYGSAAIYGDRTDAGQLYAIRDTYGSAAIYGDWTDASQFICNMSCLWQRSIAGPLLVSIWHVESAALLRGTELLIGTVMLDAPSPRPDFSAI
jgi:hypothetical protein